MTAPPPVTRTIETETTRSRADAILKGVLVLAVVGALLVLFLFNPQQHGFYPFCLFYRTTGLLCPGCGSLRALHELLHGHWLGALRLNPLLVLSLPVLVFWAAKTAFRKRESNRSSGIPDPWIWTGLIVLLLFGIVRNLPFYKHALGQI